jgi:hypothetical protein
MSNVAVETVVHVDGLAMHRDADGAFRIRDVDLAERLGFDRPRKIRELIARMVEQGLLPGVFMRPTVGRTSMPRGGVREDVVNEYWLDRVEALLVVMKSETPEANRWCRVIATVFDRALTAGQFVFRQDPEVTRLAIRIQRLEAKDYESAWEQEVVNELARITPHIVNWDNEHNYRANDKRMHWALGKTWRVILGDTVYDELRRRCPHPCGGNLYGQWITGERMKLVRREDMVITLFISRRSLSWREYERDMRSHFRRAPIQLQIGSSSRLSKVGS